MERSSNTHHVFFDRRGWNQNQATKRLRGDPRTHIVLPIWMHQELHEFCGPLPAESRLARLATVALGANPKHYDNLDHVKSLTDMFASLEGAELMAQGLHDQLPFLIIGTKALKRRVV